LLQQLLTSEKQVSLQICNSIFWKLNFCPELTIEIKAKRTTVTGPAYPTATFQHTNSHKSLPYLLRQVLAKSAVGECGQQKIMNNDTLTPSVPSSESQFFDVA